MAITIGANDAKKIYIGSSEIASARVGTTKVRPSGWKPWANTIAYYPLESDVLDYSWNWNNWSGSPNSFTDGVANYSWNSTTLPKAIINRSVYTVNVWANNSGQTKNTCFIWQHTQSSYWFNMVYTKNSMARYITWPNSNTYSMATYNDANIQGWHLITWVSDGTTMYLYVDGEQKATNTYRGTNNQTLYMGYDHWYNGGAWNWKISKLIIENKVWTADEIVSYYNQTKWNYGL